MPTRARTPEELETSFEDAFVVGDADDLSSLFADGGVLVAGQGAEARGAAAIRRAAGRLWDAGNRYPGGTVRVVQARDLALVAGPAGTRVARRGGDGTWRVAIALLQDHDQEVRR